jgi:hypothetical protein
MRISRNVFGLLKHHMFEKMRETGSARFLVYRSNVIPNVYSNSRQAMVFDHQDVQSVGQRPLFNLQLRNGRLLNSASLACSGRS